MKRERLTMSQALVKFLDNQYIEFDGVESKFVSGIFGIFGHGCVVGVGQALEQGGHNLKFYQGKNEQNMALAAVAYAKHKDRKAIIPCVSSIGPGATNMVTACGCATANRIPLLVLPGDTFACRQPDPVLQQAEFFDNYGRTVTDAFKGVCHYFDRINRPEQLMTACLNAMRVLTDPADTGAVCLAMPQDVEGEAYDYPEHFLKKRVWHIDRRPIAKSQLDRAVRMIKESKKPIIICGGGVRYSDAEKQLLAFAEKYNIPIAETQAGKGIIPWQNPLNLGGIGVTGGKAANVIGRDADLVIGVGTRFSDFTTSSKWLFNENRKVLAINICPFDAYKMDAEAVVADAREALDALADALNGYKTKYNDEISKAKAEWDAIVDDYYTKELDGGLNQTLALGIINEFMGDEDIALGSAGSLPGDMQRLFRPKGRGTYHMEYGFSNMGYEVNGALGAKLAKPEAEVYTFCGDGSFLMGHSELYTAVQEGLKINVCLFDNLGWGCIENLQNNQGTDTFGTVFRARNPKTGMLDGAEIAVDFAKIAEGYGAKGYSIHNSAELRAALEDAKKRTEPVLFDIKVLPKTMTPGFESWWRVGVAEVSKSESVRAAYDDMQKNIKKTFDY
ncbi:3D-(3,5/4)-trihydroxycyclohexane-1,2-dione acylhydrolase (decyclizing) [Eubacterium sp.]|uniref:3D-(3,5/4)-trihydroxycyclohexane-1,2-dione acylhydrolase (decyclizing) n=1 Tax=Eubacterium sp. TaxID=142586 RepID=UPI002A80884F|nr:3D-(3,5/4)-trihydroxycyclohexane-1,2-dione acylhydrolase (decyclizing) [Eubacterium sp.]MDY3812584.1 3D-(3,5/4)-trihydroxycyclohexane-1,2-dione acylhydrolase (decyclizing) [Eubacterium sp.]